MRPLRCSMPPPAPFTSATRFWCHRPERMPRAPLRLPRHQASALCDCTRGRASARGCRQRWGVVAPLNSRHRGPDDRRRVGPRAGGSDTTAFGSALAEAAPTVGCCMALRRQPADRAGARQTRRRSRRRSAVGRVALRQRPVRRRARRRGGNAAEAADAAPSPARKTLSRAARAACTRAASPRHPSCLRATELHLTARRCGGSGSDGCDGDGGGDGGDRDGGNDRSGVRGRGRSNLARRTARTRMPCRSHVSTWASIAHRGRGFEGERTPVFGARRGRM
mmetsp:Transcript_28017/g.75692  ORF Transcript_28017/g.75692 Transcript_28017/m.75692 type:complete len:279 (+) Transcript_28017:195-1031(+)